MGVLFSFERIRRIGVEIANAVKEVTEGDTLVRVTFVNDDTFRSNNPTWSSVEPGMRFSAIASSVEPPFGWCGVDTCPDDEVSENDAKWLKWFEVREMETESFITEREQDWLECQQRGRYSVLFSENSSFVSRTSMVNTEFLINEESREDSRMTVACSFHVAIGTSCGRLMIAYSSSTCEIRRKILDRLNDIVVSLIEKEVGGC